VALRHELPDEMSPAQVRAALAAVIGRTLDGPGRFDADGWPRIGLCGNQPGVAEAYISTGSLYLCAAAFLPSALPRSIRSGPRQHSRGHWQKHGPGSHFQSTTRSDSDPETRFPSFPLTMGRPAMGKVLDFGRATLKNLSRFS
jgi:hypothetical protein